jgi:lipid-binding SYLF domain-containing protein
MTYSLRPRALLVSLLLALPTLLLVPAGAALAQSREEARLTTATQVLEELRDAPDQGVPSWLLDRAYGVAVIPDVIKGALFTFGGRRGKGVLSARDATGRFSEPVFISLTGGSVGLQLGAQASDVVLVFATRRSLENFGRGQFTLGATASAAAGPVGRSGEAAAGVEAEIYSYSRARGLFAGVALDGTVLAFDSDANRNFYGHDVTTELITSGQVKSNSEASRRFIAAITASLPQGAAGSAAATPANSKPLPAPASGTGSSPATEPARSFPLADPKPGSEPTH